MRRVRSPFRSPCDGTRLVAALVAFAVTGSMAGAQSARTHNVPPAWQERVFAPRLIDPRSRPPRELEELGVIAGRLLQANRLPLSINLVAGHLPGKTLARISGPPENATVTIQAWALSRFPANSWAFILGHEFAHRTDPRAMRSSGGSPEQVEIAAEITGATYAIRAGYDLDSHLQQLFHGPDGRARARGITLQKALALQEAFRR